MQNRMNLKIKKLENFNNIRQREYGNAGYDLYAAEAGTIRPGERAMVSVGIATSFSPNYYMRVAPRSGLAVKNGVDVLAGVIDSSYRGEWKVILHNSDSLMSYTYNVGDRIAQAIPEVISIEHFEIVDILDETKRSDNGFGSTGQ